MGQGKQSRLDQKSGQGPGEKKQADDQGHVVRAFRQNVAEAGDKFVAEDIEVPGAGQKGRQVLQPGQDKGGQGQQRMEAFQHGKGRGVS